MPLRGLEATADCKRLYHVICVVVIIETDNDIKERGNLWAGWEVSEEWVWKGNCLAIPYQ